LTETEFKFHFKRLYNKYPNHFKKGKDHIDREYRDWYDNFIKLDNDIMGKALDYHATNFSENWFPTIPDMLNYYNLMWKDEQNKEVSYEPVKRGSLKPLYDSIQVLKKRIADNEVPIGFTDNNFEEQYVEAGRGDTRPRRVDYTTVNSAAECFVQMWDNTYEAPALAEYRREKLKEPKRNRSAEEMLDGFFTLGSGKQIKQKLCYYCEQRVERNSGVFECSKCGVKYL